MVDSIVTFQGISERLGFVLTYLGNHPLAGGGGEKDRAHAVRKEFLSHNCCLLSFHKGMLWPQLEIWSEGAWCCASSGSSQREVEMV